MSFATLSAETPRDRKPVSSTTNAALFGAVLGLFVFEASLGIALAHPRYIDWLLYGEDARVHFLGWHMYRHAPWTFPIGQTPSFVYPFGTSVGLTDSIPILAFVFKALDSLLGTDWQYIGLWLLSCWVLQGVFGALLVSTATSSAVLQALGASLFVMSPPLLLRWGHAALSAHWMLLAALWLYFAPWARQSARRSLMAWAALVGVASATHPYLAAMILALAGASHMRAVIERPAKWLSAAVLPLSLLAMWSGFALWQAGYFVRGSGISSELGFGDYSMNVLAPLMPGVSSAIFGPGPFASRSAAQYEGFSYPGAGLLMLALVAIAAVALGRRRAEQPPRWLLHAPLVAVCVVMIVFAISPRVTAGTRVLFEYPAAVWGPLGVFRASGRFVWVPFYAATAVVIAVIVKTMPFRVAAAVLAAVVLLQAYDLNAAYRGARSIRTMRWQGPLFNAFWSEAPRHYKHLTLWPTNLCEPSGRALDYVPFALVAGRAGATLNGGFEARNDLRHFVDYCRSFEARRTRGEVSDDDLYVMAPGYRSGVELRARQPVTCFEVDGYSVCMTTRSYETWHSPSPAPLPE
jgi:hypothetical protein